MTQSSIAPTVPAYQPAETEAKWQARWEADRLYSARDGQNPKFYFLTMFPYPSGDLHMGHWYAMTPTDTAARYRRMTGWNVLMPMGFDAFGLPAENAAIKRGIHPRTWTLSNIANMRRQLRSMGAMFDWSREVVTCEPEYYRWNQWMFLKMHERGLAYRARAVANWCPKDQTVLANEQVTAAGLCERCDTPVERRELEQWFLKITNYADELLNHEGMDWPEGVKQAQKNWIGRSEGVELTFGIEGSDDQIRVFTTRPDTVFGVTFVVLAPEHPLVARLTTPDRKAEVEAYVDQAKKTSEIDRQATDREKTGVPIGAYAINKLSGERVPIWTADYVLSTYGTGAVMGVPAHDVRDFAFAQKYGLDIPVVIAPPEWDGNPLAEAYTDPGTMVNSGQFNGLESVAGKTAIGEFVEANNIGERKVIFRMRDWLVSRQRYWGTPIPMIYCPACGVVPVPEEDLPVVLPDDAEFTPTGQSPLQTHAAFLNVPCPKCGEAARRETDTMDTFVDSSWYWYRYTSPHEDSAPFNKEAAEFWTPVDQYTGGAEHATMHLLYARFWTKVLRDLGLVNHNEPFTRLFNQGQILGPNGQRMSKSRGNVVAPDDYVQRLGADTVRLFLMGLGPWEKGAPWNDQAINGVTRWLNRVWTLVMSTKDATPSDSVNDNDIRVLRRLTHQTLRQVTDDIETFRFNTMVSALQKFTNGMTDLSHLAGTPAWKEATDLLILMLAPSSPHIAEELWAQTGHNESVHLQRWPALDEAATAEDSIEVPIQVNGKLRDKITVAADATEDQIRDLAMASPKVQAHTDGKQVVKAIYVPGRMLNIVVR